MAGNANSGRKPIPANVHLLNGNPSKLSAAQLAAGAGAKKTTIAPAAVAPPCPDFLTADAKSEWRRVVGVLVILGLISKIDRSELAVYCQAWADWKYARIKIKEMRDAGFVETTPSGYKQISAWMQCANRAEDRMRQAGNSFGMNPAARSRLDIRAPQGELFKNDEKDKAAAYF